MRPKIGKGITRIEGVAVEDDGISNFNVFLDERAERPRIVTFDKKGFNSTSVNAIKLLAWIRRNRPDILVADLKGATRDEWESFMDMLRSNFCLSCGGKPRCQCWNDE